MSLHPSREGALRLAVFFLAAMRLSISEQDYSSKLQQPIPLALDVILVPDLPVCPVVSHLAILNADRSHLVRSFASADLLPSVLSPSRSYRLLPCREDPSSEKLQSEVPVQVLAALTLDTHANACRDVGHLHRRLGFVHVLTTRAATPASLPVYVTFVDVQIVSPRLCQDRNSDGRRVNSAFAQALPSMATRFKTEEMCSPFPRHLKCQEPRGRL